MKLRKRVWVCVVERRFNLKGRPDFCDEVHPECGWYRSDDISRDLPKPPKESNSVEDGETP